MKSYKLYAVGVFNIVLSIFAAATFHYSDSIPDKNTYIELSKHAFQSGFIETMYTFNGFELFSYMLFWFIGFLDHIGIAVTISLSIVILSYTLIFLNTASKTSGFIYISYLLLVFLIYFQDFWLNQLRITVSLVIFFYVFTRLAYVKDFWKSKIVIVFPIFFHIQIFAAVVPSVINSKYFGIILVGSAFLFKELLTDNIMVMLTNNIDSSTASKIFEYYNMPSLTNSNLIQLIRVALMAALSLVLYFVYKRGSLALLNISCANLFFGVIFYDYPSIFGRITSLLIFFEPLLISSLGKSLFKYLYILLLMANIIFKNLAN